MVVSWARAILSISKKSWTFPARPYYYKLSFLKISRKPNNSKTEGRKGHTWPLGQPRGEELPCRFLPCPVTLFPGQPWGEGLPCRFLPCPVTLFPGQPRGEGLPCRFLPCPVTLFPGQPWGEGLPCRFLSRPGGSQHPPPLPKKPFLTIPCLHFCRKAFSSCDETKSLS